MTLFGNNFHDEMFILLSILAMLTFLILLLLRQMCMAVSATPTSQDVPVQPSSNQTFAWTHRCSIRQNDEEVIKIFQKSNGEYVAVYCKIPREK